MSKKQKCQDVSTTLQSTTEQVKELQTDFSSLKQESGEQIENLRNDFEDKCRKVH